MNSFYKFKHRFSSVLFAALMTAIPASAQENDKFKFKVGLQASASIPQNKLEPWEQYNEIGVTNGRGYGAFVELVWYSSFAVRLQYEAMTFDKYKRYFGNEDITSSQNMTILDFVFYNKIKYLPHFFGGVAVGDEKVSSRLDDQVGGDLHYGLGYYFTKNLGIEIKHVITRQDRYQASVLLLF